MAIQIGGVLDWLRRPEYTGPNRCVPCTIANAVIAVVVAVVVAVALSIAGRAPDAILAGGVVLGGASAVIYLRGYLLPGTPRITKQYFPDWVLRRFDKVPEPRQGDAPGIEAYLTRVSALEDCVEVDDLCLTSEFRSAWQSRIASIREDERVRAELAAVLDVTPEDLDWMQDDQSVTIWAQRREIGTWESDTALLADVAAWKELSERDSEWWSIPFQRRQEMLRALRIFLDECPTCGGVLESREETAETCCRTLTLNVIVCGTCANRLLTTDVTDL